MAMEKKTAVGWAARDASGVLSPISFSRSLDAFRALSPSPSLKVVLSVLYCGICHTDLHTIKNEWGNTMYPVVPGHEIVGIVTEVGEKVTKFKTGDKIGVGFMVNSCSACVNCMQDLENYCPKIVPTCNGIDHDGTTTYGGFADTIVVSENYAVNVPENLPLDKAAPLLCAGVSVYSPMKYFGLNKPGKHLGVVGLGGLGHIAVKFGKALGMKVTVISSSASKEKEALEHLKADAFVVSRNAEQMKAAMGTMDGIINTVSAVHPIVSLIFLLNTHGKMIMLGVPNKPLELPVYSLITAGRIVAGSQIGGMKDTQETINFAGENNITADVEVVNMDYVNTAMERLAKGDVRYRFVVDVANTLPTA